MFGPTERTPEPATTFGTMSDYVPYDERIRQASESDRSRAEGLEASRRQLLEDVEDRIRRLKGERTNAYLEVLKPVKGLERAFGRKTTIERPGMMGGPDFVIAEVIPAYRLQSAIIKPAFQDLRRQAFDGYVVPDGRVWRFAGEPDTPNNTLQVLASSVEQISGQSAETLRRIKDTLPT